MREPMRGLAVAPFGSALAAGAVQAAAAEVKKDVKKEPEAVRAIPAPALDARVDLFGFPASKRAYLMILMSHAHEHLGQAIAYARSVGVVPPWTARAQAAAGGGE